MLCFVACVAPRGTAHRAVTALVGVDILPMTSDVRLAGQTLLIEDGVIRRIGPAAEVAVPDGALVIDGRSKVVMPGLADMHVHLSDDAKENERIIDLSLAHGVTLLRGMQGAAAQLELRARLNAHDVAAPTLLLAGPIIASAMTVDEARATVRAQKAAGYDFIKVIGGFDRAAYDAIIETARAEHIPVVGHVPKSVDLAYALERQATVEHVTAFLGPPDDGPMLAARSGAAVCPTLDWLTVAGEDASKLLKREGLDCVTAAELAEWKKWRAETPPIEPARLTGARRAVVELSKAGARLIVGSDSPGEFRVPGFAYLEELGDLERVGLAPFTVLRAATANAAEALGDASFGVVAEGKRADLVVLSSDPRENLAALARPFGVMVRGKWLSAAALDERLAKYRGRQ
jgi:imidazolonepropionase-like amidohydrolase